MHVAPLRYISTKVSNIVAHIQAPDLNSAQQSHHVREVVGQLRQNGILKISLGFSDEKSQYLEQLLHSLHHNHGHNLPITHSATRGWFWDIRPSEQNFQTANCQARSETMKQFPWHTDCSYEDPPPRYFALQVLHPDRYGGGTLSIMNVRRLSERLSPTTRADLMRPEYRITTPPEFIKDSTPPYVVGSLILADKEGRPSIMRFRDDILEPLSERASRALDELKQVLHGIGSQSDLIVKLTPDDLPGRAIILVDNRRWLHARTDVKDPERHLRRLHVLAIADIHPFYVSDIKYPYPPDASTVCAAKKRAQGRKEASSATIDLRSRALLPKKNLYSTIKRLIDDTSPRNSYRQSVYASFSGGGFSAKPLLFATDVYENRKQRTYFGRFLRLTGLVGPGDWVLTVHSSGELYRSLDLISEITENAGASVLSAGNLMSAADVCKILADYHVNVLSGDSSQVVKMAHHISTLPSEKRDRIKLDKIIYTSEVLTAAQRTLIKAVLGPIKICSILGSAEAGPWAVSNPDLTGTGPVVSHADFVFDTRAMLIEILPPSTPENGSGLNLMPDGEQGIIVQTSLMRLRNPVVRYITGDIGSLHSLPEHSRALIPEGDWPYLRVLRLEGRDRRFSFEWDGEYIEFDNLSSLLDSDECGVLQWQVILDKIESSLESSLEIRLLCSARDGKGLISERVLVDRVRSFFHAYSANDYRFHLVLVKNIDGFERSSTGRKVVKTLPVMSSGLREKAMDLYCIKSHELVVD
ncbi:hypothetical protein F4781DRAFT_425259 [Annulohypoxylon bovei var. microspora]|nr:hypothetical protein F4781DRAFT_425259 [Annulohypoxylon bovei var. microspora]